MSSAPDSRESRVMSPEEEEGAQRWDDLLEYEQQRVVRWLRDELQQYSHPDRGVYFYVLDKFTIRTQFRAPERHHVIALTGTTSSSNRQSYFGLFRSLKEEVADPTMEVKFLPLVGDVAPDFPVIPLIDNTAWLEGQKWYKAAQAAQEERVRKITDVKASPFVRAGDPGGGLSPRPSDGPELRRRRSREPMGRVPSNLAIPYLRDTKQLLLSDVTSVDRNAVLVFWASWSEECVLYLRDRLFTLRHVDVFFRQVSPRPDKLPGGVKAKPTPRLDGSDKVPHPQVVLINVDTDRVAACEVLVQVEQRLEEEIAEYNQRKGLEGSKRRRRREVVYLWGGRSGWCSDVVNGYGIRAVPQFVTIDRASKTVLSAGRLRYEETEDSGEETDEEVDFGCNPVTVTDQQYPSTVPPSRRESRQQSRAQTPAAPVDSIADKLQISVSRVASASATLLAVPPEYESPDEDDSDDYAPLLAYRLHHVTEPRRWVDFSPALRKEVAHWLQARLNRLKIPVTVQGIAKIFHFDERQRLLSSFVMTGDIIRPQEPAARQVLADVKQYVSDVTCRVQVHKAGERLHLPPTRLYCVLCKNRIPFRVEGSVPTLRSLEAQRSVGGSVSVGGSIAGVSSFGGSFTNQSHTSTTSTAVSPLRSSVELTPPIAYTCVNCPDYSFLVCEACEATMDPLERRTAADRSAVLRHYNKTYEITGTGEPRRLHLNEAHEIWFTGHRGGGQVHNVATHTLLQIHPYMNQEDLMWGYGTVSENPIHYKGQFSEGQVMYAATEEHWGVYCNHCAGIIHDVRWKSAHDLSVDLCTRCEKEWLQCTYSSQPSAMYSPLRKFPARTAFLKIYHPLHADDADIPFAGPTSTLSTKTPEESPESSLEGDQRDDDYS